MIKPKSESHPETPGSRWSYPPLGNDPSSTAEGTTPGSFALPPQIGTAYTFSSADAPGMPAVSDKTAWDFMPPPQQKHEPVTQLEHARHGTITPQMKRVADREPQLTPQQVRSKAPVL